MMAALHQVLIEVPLPIRTQRLLIRSKQLGDGIHNAEAVAETWQDLHQWMRWAERLEDFTPEQQEIITRQQMALFVLREEFNLVGIELVTGQPVVWCGLHDIDWNARQCDTGFWVRKSAQGRGFATEAATGMIQFAFHALGMKRVGITHSSGNEASRRVVQKLGFAPEGVQRAANPLPDGGMADKHLYGRRDTVGLACLDVSWGDQLNVLPLQFGRSSKGRVIILNGTSSAGKSTLAAALRLALEPGFSYYASDQLADSAFRPLETTTRDATREAFFHGFHRSIAAFASAGNDLLVEHIVEEQSWNDELFNLLAPFDVFWVGVHAPPEEISRRERERHNRTLGEGLYHLKTHSFCQYDLEVDSTQPLDHNVQAILEAWEARPVYIDRPRV